MTVVESRAYVADRDAWPDRKLESLTILALPLSSGLINDTAKVGIRLDYENVVRAICVPLFSRVGRCTCVTASQT